MFGDSKAQVTLPHVEAPSMIVSQTSPSKASLAPSDAMVDKLQGVWTREARGSDFLKYKKGT